MKTKPTFSEIIDAASQNDATGFISFLESENIEHDITDMNIMDWNKGFFSVVVESEYGQEEFNFSDGVLTTQFEEDEDAVLDLDYDYEFED